MQRQYSIEAWIESTGNEMELKVLSSSEWQKQEFYYKLLKNKGETILKSENNKNRRGR